ncbi:MAG: hypothetical protein M3N17_01895 [Actinomycetota bacterium]|nr:hypothetical protein [Actinomycetota bacterium]
MVVPATTYRCAGCGQLLPFDGDVRVPDACLRRCQGRCDWREIGPTHPAVRARAALEGPPGPDGLPVTTC